MTSQLGADTADLWAAPGTALTRGLAGLFASEPSVAVLASRIAATVAHHEPGWRLPRVSVLARYYGVKPAHIAAAMNELGGRRIVRRLQDGQFVRASPADYMIPLATGPGMSVRILPIAGSPACRSAAISRQLADHDISWALGVEPDTVIEVLKAVYAVGNQVVGISTTYATALPAALVADVRQLECAAILPLVIAVNERATAADAGLAQVVQLEFSHPPPGIASGLGLGASEQAIIIAVRVDNPDAGRPAGLTVATLRPDCFRLSVQTADQPLPPPADNGAPAAGPHVRAGWAF